MSFTALGNESSRMVNTQPSLVKYYDPHTGNICIPLDVFRGSEDLMKQSFELLKIKQFKNPDDGKYYNWGFEYALVWSDEEEDTVDGVCMRLVESF